MPSTSVSTGTWASLATASPSLAYFIVRAFVGCRRAREPRLPPCQLDAGDVLPCNSAAPCEKRRAPEITRSPRLPTERCPPASQQRIRRACVAGSGQDEGVLFVIRGEDRAQPAQP